MTNPQTLLLTWTSLKPKLLTILQKNKVYDTWTLTHSPLSKTHPGWVARKDILRQALKNYRKFLWECKGQVPPRPQNRVYWKTAQEELAECDWLLKELEDKEQDG